MGKFHGFAAYVPVIEGGQVVRLVAAKSRPIDGIDAAKLVDYNGIDIPALDMTFGVYSMRAVSSILRGSFEDHAVRIDNLGQIDLVTASGAETRISRALFAGGLKAETFEHRCQSLRLDASVIIPALEATYSN